MVGCVESIQAKFDVDAFCDGRGFGKTKIDILPAEVSELVNLFVPLTPCGVECGKRELRDLEGTATAALRNITLKARRAQATMLMIAGHIRKAKPVAVSREVTADPTIRRCAILNDRLCVLAVDVCRREVCNMSSGQLALVVGLRQSGARDRVDQT